MGKTSWVTDAFASATTFDLLDTRLSIQLNRDPNVLYRQLVNLDEGAWVVIDEIQRIPELLNEVHRLIERNGIHFLMTGSSARKLRRGGVNLLGGRAYSRKMFPLVSAELADDFETEKALQYGCLPTAINEPRPIDYLQGYVENYLSQEILAESAIRNVGGFVRFLEVAARQNGQAVNPSSIARDVGVSRPTVVSHFDILVDTLMGTWLPAWRRKRTNKQLQQSKFYFFDCGITRAILNRVAYPLLDEERGALLETLILNELRAYLEYSGLRLPIHYWRTYDGAEVDFIIETPNQTVALEVKSSARWQSRNNRGFRRFVKEYGSDKPVLSYGIFRGLAAEFWDDVQVLPIREFLGRLWGNEVVN